MAKRGVLLINLGSPEAPTTPAVRRYLNEFLCDPYVIDTPAPFRQLLVYGLISPRRAPNSAEAYAKIWRPDGSPLVVHTRNLAMKVATHLASDYEVRWAMRYGAPNIRDLPAWNVDEVLLVPLYPQYAESSTRTAIEAAQKVLPMPTRVLEEFHAREEFLSSQAEVIQRRIDEYRPDHLLLSFHGLPEHHITKLHPNHCLRSEDCCAQVTEANRHCYRAQSYATARGLKERLKFPTEKIRVSFQSRLGRRPWIKPYTDVVIEELAKEGAKRVAVSCPSFVADCLETLEEVQMRLREQFLAAGGEDLVLIPALNDDDGWAAQLAKMVRSL